MRSWYSWMAPLFVEIRINNVFIMQLCSTFELFQKLF